MDLGIRLLYQRDKVKRNPIHWKGSLMHRLCVEIEIIGNVWYG
jgi:hypothetical protein